MKDLFDWGKTNSIVLKCLFAFVFFGELLLISTFTVKPAVNAQDEMEILISNDQFVFRPDKYEWNIQGFLDAQPGVLKSYQFQTDSGLFTAKEEIEFLAFQYSINPQVILAILEVEDQLLSNPNPSEESIVSQDVVAENGIFSAHVRQIAETLYLGYYVSLDEGYAEFSATRAILATLTKETKPEKWNRDDWELGYAFQAIFENYFGNPVEVFEEPLTLSTTPVFQLPWTEGHFWRYGSKGPHPGDFINCVPGNCLFPQSSGVINAALDFIPQNANSNSIDCAQQGANYGMVAGEWVVSIAPGKVIYANKSLVVVEHADGWFSQYYHIAAQDRVPKDTQLNGISSSERRIGHPSNSCELGGQTDISHVHFLVGRNGQYVPATDLVLSGWSVQTDRLTKAEKEPILLNNYVESTNPFTPMDTIKRTSKWINISIPWWYTLFTGDGGSFRAFYNGEEIFSYSGEPSCVTASVTRWFGRGQHLIEIEYSGDQRPSIDKVAWPVKTPCGYNPPAPPPTDPQPPPEATLPPPVTSDAATFLIDVTLPNFTAVTPSESLIKTWRVRNSGTSTWDGYSLVFQSGDQMGAIGSVAVPHTTPGQEVDLSVNMTAPAAEGQYVGYWRLRDPQGVYFGPQLSVNINVQEQSSYAIFLTADPTPPADADRVQIHARADNFPDFRAMRLKIDGAVVYEVGAPEFSYNWNTAGYTAGDHSIVVEVANQTDTSWSYPEIRTINYTLTGNTNPANHAPYVPDASSPNDWHVYYTGNTAQLCAQNNGDPDGDTITGYYFDIYDSPQLWNSGWTGNNCVSTGALGPYTYQWRVKVRDNHGAESDWSDSRHFTLVNPSLTITDFYFEPQDADSEQVKIRACTTGQGGVGITMRVSVNDAADGSDSGNWHIIKELGVPCFNATDAPVWQTLAYGDGPHLVRVEAHGSSTGWDGAAVAEQVYTLPHRRPAAPNLTAPRPLSGNVNEAVYLNSRTVSFRWDSVLQANNYTLHVSANPSPKDDPNPIFRQTFGSGTTQYTVTLDQNYAALYWQVTAANGAGTNTSGAQRFGIDVAAPSCSVQSLPVLTYETVFQVNWSGSDNLASIRSYDVQFLDSDRGVWRDWLTSIPIGKTYELFIGQPGHTYSFRCRAIDNAGNMGGYPANADASTTVDPTARPPEPWWNNAYSYKRNLTILNNMPGVTLPAGYPVHLHFDANTSPTAAELYNASQSNPKCNDLRIVFDDNTELDRVVQNCSASAIDIWFRTQVNVNGGASNNTDHQLYYGNPAAGTPPGSPNTVFDPPADGNTVGLWYMNEGGGSTLNDSSGYGNNCSIDPTTSWVAPAKFIGALRFAGGTDGATVNCGTSAVFNLQTFTFEMYFKRTGAAWGRLAGHLGNNQNRWMMILNGNGTIGVTIWPCPTCGAETFNSAAAISDTINWHHVAFTLQNSTLKIYIDGQLDSTYQVAWGNIRSGTPPLTIGSAENSQRVFAEVSHVRLSNIARTNFPYGTFTAITTEPIVAAGIPVTPPATGTPDLAVLDLTTYPNPDGGILVEAVIQNQGDIDTQNGFYTDLYMDHLPTGAGDYAGSMQFWVNDSIEAGAVVTLTTVITSGAVTNNALFSSAVVNGETSGRLYAQVDSTGSVSETDDGNNIYAVGADICLTGADVYEDDNTAVTAAPIALGETQTHNFDRIEDEDWLRFTAEAGVTYTLRTSNLGVLADTYLYLYDSDGTTLLAANDDYDGALSSYIEWTAPASGIYYARIRHWNPNVAGCGTSYTFTLAEPGFELFLPVVLRP